MELFKQQPNCSVFIHRHVNGDHSGKATVNFLLIINLTKETWNRCLSSTSLISPCITFDQPLLRKVFETYKTKKHKHGHSFRGFHFVTLSRGDPYHIEINLLCKSMDSMDWFLYDSDLCHERVNIVSWWNCNNYGE